MTVYAQPNLKVSYNINDVVHKLDNKQQAAKVADVISKDAKYLYIKEVPVTADTNDNYVYEDKTMYYGTYAIPTISDNTTAEVKLFSVIAGTKAHSYAIIRDLETITTVPNKLQIIRNKKIPVLVQKLMALNSVMVEMITLSEESLIKL